MTDLLADKARSAALARMQLAEALKTCAGVLTQTAEALAMSSVAMHRAITAEAAATESYISALERQLSEQSALS